MKVSVVCSFYDVVSKLFMNIKHYSYKYFNFNLLTPRASEYDPTDPVSCP